MLFIYDSIVLNLFLRLILFGDDADAMDEPVLLRMDDCICA
jgi:hypothetical protein